MSVNKAILIGYLGADPEVKYLDANRVVCNFSVATDDSYYDKDGNRISQTDWHRIEMWDGLAKVAEKYLKKGGLVYIEGKIKTRHWTDKEGIERYTTKIQASVLKMLGNQDTKVNKKSEHSLIVEKPDDKIEQQPIIKSDMDDLPF